MPLSIFNHQRLEYHREANPDAVDFGHTFGGDFASSGLRITNADFPIHLLYRLNLQDPALDI